MQRLQVTWGPAFHPSGACTRGLECESVVIYERDYDRGDQFHHIVFDSNHKRRLCTEIEQAFVGTKSWMPSSPLALFASEMAQQGCSAISSFILIKAYLYASLSPVASV
jgi:hypothetical protein